MKFRTYYQPHPDDAKRNDGESMTDPQYCRDCDVNHILDEFQRTGAIPPNTNGEGAYGDFSSVGDFGALMQQYTEAREMFMELPASVRARFGHDPKAFYDFVNNPENADEMVKLGLAQVRAPAEIPVVRVLKEESVTPEGGGITQ